MEAWGIMNVKNATIYSLSQNEGGSNLLVPTLFLDSLKVSDISQNAGSIIWAAAKEKGLIGWSNPKSIYSLSMEDSLFSIGNLNLTLGREFFKNLINEMEYFEEYTLFHSFIYYFDYCEKNNIELLPENLLWKKQIQLNMP